MNLIVCAMVLVIIVHGGKWVEARVHHFVGDDRGWNAGSNIASWADARTFTVGDFLWFPYSGGLEKDNVVELRSRDEFESCDVSNPIMMFTQGIDEKISLENEGNRYFASSNVESCKKGLKLPIEIKSKSTVEKESLRSSTIFLAEGPSSPTSSSTKIYGSIMMVVFAIILSYIGLLNVAY